MAVTITLWVLLIALIAAFVWMRWKDNRDADATAQSDPTRPAADSGAREEDAPGATEASSATAPTGADGSLQDEAGSLFSGSMDADAAIESDSRQAAPAEDTTSSPPPGAKRHWLVGVTKDLKDKAFHVGEQTATIGRLPNNLVQIDSGNVSRVHCQLRGSSQHLQVMPMETKNGTRINGELTEPHSLHPLSEGDFLEIGNSVLVYREYAEQDDGAGAKKRRGISVEAATALVGGDAWSERLKDELRSHGGDIPQTARTLGIEPDVLEHMITQLGLET